MTQAFWNPSVDDQPSEEIEHLAATRRVRSVLDVGCGTGRNLLPFAKQGCRLHGIDINPEAVNVARQRLAGTAASVEIELGDVRSWASPQTFDFVICHGVLHFLNREDRLSVYGKLASWVAPGGLLSVVMFNNRVPIPDDLRGLIPEPAQDSEELRSAFPGWLELSFRSYDFSDEHDQGKVRHMHSIDRLIVQAPEIADA